MDFTTYWIIVPPAGNALALPLWAFLLLTWGHTGDRKQQPLPDQALRKGEEVRKHRHSGEEPTTS